jgi:GNAT superfamily N-acetyltransferase
MPAWTIRRAVPEDRDIIVEYNRRMAEETEGLHLDLAILTKGVETALTDPNHCLYFVAEAEVGVIGQVMVTFEWSDWRNGRVWWFQSVYVAQEWRRHGVFRSLYEHVVQEGKRSGAIGFRLYAVSDNTRALDTYRSLGLSPTHYIVLEHFPR